MPDVDDTGITPNKEPELFRNRNKDQEERPVGSLREKQMAAASEVAKAAASRMKPLANRLRGSASPKAVELADALARHGANLANGVTTSSVMAAYRALQPGMSVVGELGVVGAQEELDKIVGQLGQAAKVLGGSSVAVQSRTGTDVGRFAPS